VVYLAAQGLPWYTFGMLEPPKRLSERSAPTTAVAGTTAVNAPSEIAHNRSLFISAMAHPAKRRIAFDVVERNCRYRFVKGQEGLSLFLELIGYVQAAGVAGAVSEFENRFVAMLDQELLKTKLDESQ
jgi:hypothetical protein